MTYEDLKKILDTSGGTVTISRDALGSAVNAMLSAAYLDQPVVISGAGPGDGDGVGGAVVVTGHSSFLQVPDLPVTARFTIEGDGSVRALLMYRLRDAAPGPGAWTFSRSFPDLPTSWNYETGSPDPHEEDPSAAPPQKPYVEALNLLETYFAVTSHAGQEPASGSPLEPGINLVSRLRPDQLLGVLKYAIGDVQPLVLHGPIRVPRPTDRTPPLVSWLQRPWDRTDVPGIHLRAPLDLDFKAGKLVFNQTALRIYCPPSQSWQAANSTFQPLHGYTGRLSIPSAGLELDLSADLEWGVPRAFLLARCEGVTLGKLAQLMDLAGTGDLASNMPDALRDAAGALAKLELLDLAIDVGLNVATPVCKSVYFTVGMPDLRWKVWDDHLQVESISCRFEVSDPFTPQAAVGVTLMGTMSIEGVQVTVAARKAEGWSLYARVDEVEIPLERFMKTYAPGVPPPSDLTINSLAVSLAPGQGYGMSLMLGSQPRPWTVPLGRSNVTISDVLFTFSYSKGSSVTGSFAGSASLGKVLRLDVGLSIPGSFAIRGTFPEVNLTGLIDELCDKVIPLPGGFDLKLENASVLIQKQGDNYTFLAATSVAGFGALAFEVRKVAGSGWGFAAGLNMGSAGLSNVPGLGALKAIEKAFALQKLMLVVASFEDPGFAFPDLAQLNQPQLGTGSQVALPAQASGVIPGLTLFAEWRLDDDSREQKLLKDLLGLSGTLSATVVVGANPAKDFRLFVSQQGALQKHPFQYRFGISLSGGQPSFFLTGTLITKIQGQAQSFDLTTVFVPAGAFMSATMKGATAVDCGPFKLSNLALQLGMNWGGIPSLGIAATIAVETFSSSVAVFFDSTDPSRSLVAGSISDLTARDVLDAFTGGAKTDLDAVLEKVAIKGTHEFTLPASVAASLDGLDFAKVATAFAAAKVTIPSSAQQLSLVQKKKGQSWQLTDMSIMRHYELDRQGGAGGKIKARISPQFYFAPQPTFIGTIKFPQRFYINAAISIVGFDAAVTIEIVPDRFGFLVDAEMDSIVVVDQKLFSLKAAQGRGGPRISISTFAQPAETVPEFRPPHFYVSGALTILGVKRSVLASVTVKGVLVELKGQLVPGVTFDVDGRFDKTGVEAGGTVKVGVGTVDLGPLGKVKINTQLDASLDLGIGTPPSSPASAKVKGKAKTAGYIQLESSFSFAGQRYKIAKFKQVAQADTLKKLPATLAGKVGDALRATFKDATRWANSVSKGLVQGVSAPAKVLKGEFGKTAAQTAQVMKSAGYPADQVGKGLKGAYGASADATAKALKAAGYGVNEVGGALKGAYGASADATAKALKAAGYGVNEVSGALQDAYKISGKSLGKALKGAGYAAKEVDKFLSKIGDKLNPFKW